MDHSHTAAPAAPPRTPVPPTDEPSHAQQIMQVAHTVRNLCEAVASRSKPIRLKFLMESVATTPVQRVIDAQHLTHGGDAEAHDPNGYGDPTMRRIHAGDILMGRTSPHRIQVVETEPTEATGAGRMVMVIRPKADGMASRDWLSFCLRRQADSGAGLSRGVYIPTINDDVMGDLPIPVPSADDQQQVLAAKARLDAMIRGERRVVDLLASAADMACDPFGQPLWQS